MEPYKSDVYCVKCNVAVRAVLYMKDRDLMLRTCSNCGFTWHELPLDSDEKGGD